MFESGLTPDEVMDLIPVRPLGEEEENIKSIYHTSLGDLFDKLKSQWKSEFENILNDKEEKWKTKPV